MHMFQKVESIQKIQAGFSLEYQNIHGRYMNVLFSLHKSFYTNGYYPVIPIWFVFELHKIHINKNVGYIFVMKIVGAGRGTGRSTFITLEATRRTL